MNAETRKKINALAGKLRELKTQLESDGGDIENFASEEREKFDNMSDGLQQSERGQQISEAADNLDNAKSAFDDAVNSLDEAIDGLETAAAE